MAAIGRRRFLESAGVLLAAGGIPAGGVSVPAAEADQAGKPLPLQLKDFEPRSMLHVPETKVLRSRYPVIDVHTHLSSKAKHTGGVGVGEEMEYFAPVDDLLPLMERKNIRIMVNLTGGVGKGLEETIRKYQTPHPDRFLTFAEPWWERSNQPGYSQFQADEVVRAHQAGARGLKILKTLGLYLREKISTGPLVKVDVTGVSRHSLRGILPFRRNQPYSEDAIDRAAAAIVTNLQELGRQPRMARKFFEKYQDRILFGTDAVPRGIDTPQQIFNDQLYEIYYRFLETEDEYFDYAPARVPPQGRWRIYGLGLPDAILKKVYYENAARLLQIHT